MPFSIDEDVYGWRAFGDDTTKSYHGSPFRDLTDLTDVGVSCLQNTEVWNGEVVKYEDVDVDWNTLRGTEVHGAMECDVERDFLLKNCVVESTRVAKLGKLISQ